MSDRKDVIAYGDRGDLGTTGIDEAGLRITGENSLEDTQRPIADPEAANTKRCCDDERELLKNRFDLPRPPASGDAAAPK
ncbi:MAG: hypothetical protein AAGJ97_07330 [Planctomycetota bacterium]